MSKYHARKVTDDNITFDSMAEHRRYCELKLMLSAEVILNLRVHVMYPLAVNGQPICKYEADFVYSEPGGGEVIVEDVKGVRTDVYRIKRKLMKAIYNIDIREVAA